MTTHVVASDEFAEPPDEAVDMSYPDDLGDLFPEPPHPINWDTLPAADAAAEWTALDHWVTWLRDTYSLPPSVIPPLWHRHPELVWELSALHLHWLGAYDPQQHGSAPIGWHRDFAEARQRLRDWTATSGTKLDRDRPIRRVAWPGETRTPTTPESPINDRAEDFAQFLHDDLARRQHEGTGER